MRHLPKTAIILSLLLLVGCQREKAATPGFEGTWVEETTLSDTLVINPEISVLTLNRGREVTKDGYVLPRYGSGPYSYGLNNKQITLHYALSSCMCPKDYFFDVENNRLTIGNFYAHAGRPEPVLTFRKIIR
jgi:hypothetical protein